MESNTLLDYSPESNTLLDYLPKGYASQRYEIIDRNDEYSKREMLHKLCIEYLTSLH